MYLPLYNGLLLQGPLWVYGHPRQSKSGGPSSAGRGGVAAEAARVAAEAAGVAAEAAGVAAEATGVAAEADLGVVA